MGRYCAHTFVCIKQVGFDLIPDRLNSNSAGIPQLTPAVVACLYCGQVRHIEENGNVTIVVEEGKVNKKPNVSNQTSQKI